MIVLGKAYYSPSEDGQYMVDVDVRDEADGLETTMYVVFFRKTGVEDWEPVNWLKTPADAETYVKNEIAGDIREKCLTVGELRRVLERLPDDYLVNTVEDSTILGECVYVRHNKSSDYVDIGVIDNDRTRGE